MSINIDGIVDALQRAADYDLNSIFTTQQSKDLLEWIKKAERDREQLLPVVEELVGIGEIWEAEGTLSETESRLYDKACEALVVMK